jgi:hypothetical protein
MSTYTLTNEKDNTEIIKGAKLVETGDNFEGYDGTFSPDKTKYTTQVVVPADPTVENSVETTVEKVWIVKKEPEPELAGGKKRRSSKKSKKGGKKSSKKSSKKGGKKSRKTRKH